MVPREPVYSALFDLVRGSANFTTVSRRVKHWNDVAAAEMPALFMSQIGENAVVRVLGAPTEWTFSAEFYIYVRSSDPALAPTIALNALIDAVQKMLDPSTVGPGNRLVQVLGLPGVVQHCYIAGKIETDEGKLDDLAVAIIPVEILVVG